MPKPDANSPTVLVVDDEASERILMGRIIERHGFTVVTAGTCDDARKTFESYSDTLALVVADISLPDGNGFELATALRERKPDIRVLFVSGHVGAEVRRFYGPEIKEFKFLPKPFTAAQLSEHVLAELRSDAAGAAPQHRAMGRKLE